jgi:hypothetical protein
VCPTSVFEAVKISDAEMSRRASSEQLAVLKPELNTLPRVYYRNLYRYDRCFIAGAVSAVVDERIECVEGATVTLHHGGAVVAQAVTDSFGEFRFDNRGENSGDYELTITHPLHGTTTARATLGADSLNLGEIRLNTSHR